MQLRHGKSRRSDAAAARSTGTQSGAVRLAGHTVVPPRLATARAWRVGRLTALSVRVASIRTVAVYAIIAAGPSRTRREFVRRTARVAVQAVVTRCVFPVSKTFV